MPPTIPLALALSFALLTTPLTTQAKMGTMGLMGTLSGVTHTPDAVSLRFSGRLDYSFCSNPPGEALCESVDLDSTVVELPVRATARVRTDDRPAEQRATYPIVFDEIVAFLQSAAAEQRCVVVTVWNPMIAFEGDRIARIETADLTVIDASGFDWAKGEHPCAAGEAGAESRSPIN